MKRLLLLLLCFLTMVSAPAETVWTGSTTYSDYKVIAGNGNVRLEASWFRDAMIGDKVVLHFDYYAPDPQSWHQVQLWKTDYSAALASQHIVEGDDSVAFVLDASLLATLQSEGCMVAGTGYTLTSVETRFTPNGFLHTGYTPSDSIILNPERGLFHHREFWSDADDSLTIDDIDRYRQQGYSLIFTVYVLHNFRDTDISEAFLARIRHNMEVIRAGGMKAVVRFCYTYSTDDKPWDAVWSVTSRHIAQLTPILQDNADIIAVLEAGFVGVWGEWYFTDNYTFEPSPSQYGARRDVLMALLSALPSTRFVAVRYPTAKLHTLGITPADTISATTAFDGSVRSRVSFHNDCFLANADDMGTFQNNPLYRSYWQSESRYVPMGGETCAPSTLTESEMALQAFADYHWSYLNADYHPDVIGTWNSNGLLETIRRRLGYRLVLNDSYHPQDMRAGSDCPIRLYLNNEGWAAPFNPRGAEIVVMNTANGEVAYRQALHTDPRHWLPGKTIAVADTLHLPAYLSPGNYEFCLHLPDPEPQLYGRPEYSIRLANQGLWMPNEGFNRLFQATVMGTTSINGPQTATKNREVYDLSGRKMDGAHLKNGIYIIGKQKVAIRR